MTTMLTEIATDVKRFLDSNRTEKIYREISRTAIVSTTKVDIKISQSKMISKEEVEFVRTSGAKALATPKWFNDVEWIQQLDGHPPLGRNLRLNVIYPPNYLDELPNHGAYIGNGKQWLDQYGSIIGFGDRNKIDRWMPQFVAPGEHTVTTLRYPDDPTALDAYNARYRQYLDDLSTENPTIDYYRAWERANKKTNLVIGGLSLAGFGAYEVLQRGSSESEDQVDNTIVLLNYQKKKKGYIGRDIIITENGAVTEPFWDGEDDKEPASEALLAVTLKLVQDATRE